MASPSKPRAEKFDEVVLNIELLVRRNGSPVTSTPSGQRTPQTTRPALHVSGGRAAHPDVRTPCDRKRLTI